MDSSRRDLFLDMVVDRFIFKNNEISLYPYSTPKTEVELPKTVVGLSKTEVTFYCVLFTVYVT